MPLPCLDVVPVQFAFIAVTAISTTEVDDDKVVAGTKKLRGETLEQVLHQQRMAGRKADDQCFNFLQHASASAHVSRV